MTNILIDNFLSNKNTYLIKYPDKRLREKCTDFPLDVSLIKNVSNKLLNKMYMYKGVGLSGIQVGLPLNILVLNHKKDNELVIVNPKVIVKSIKLKSAWESCLSIPGLRVKLNRPSTITLEFYNRECELEKCTFFKDQARIIQHELDHLSGKLILDRSII